MADTSGMADIRGIDIDKVLKGYADENPNLMRQYVTVASTSAREIRWYQKTAGFLSSVTTTGITTDLIETSDKSKPTTIEQSFTRQTSYVKNFKADSPLISMEDEKDSDVDILVTNLTDIVKAVQRKIDLHIINVIAEDFSAANIQSISITNEWDDVANCTPISDLATAREYLKNYNYEPNGAVFVCRPDVERFLLNYLIAVKGSSIPQFSSAKVENAVLLEVLGFRVITSTLVTSDYAVIFVPQRACTYKEFTPLQTYTIDNPGIGKVVRVVSEGVALLTDPKAVVLFDNIGPS